MRGSCQPVELADGKVVWLRSLNDQDAPRLVDLCQRLSPESRRRRFLRSLVRCNPDEAQRLADVDQVTRVAVAVVADPAPDAPIIGVGRFHANGPDRAELALVVEDAYQHLGLGRVLLNYLVDQASSRNLRILEGQVLYDNRPMLRLFKTSGLPVKTQWDGGDVVSVEIQVPQAA
jgi:GNAT superfamily N-acetyltransferase